MVTTSLVCIIHPLVTMLAKMNQTSSFSEGNSEVQVDRPPRPWNVKSGVVSCFVCWTTLTKSSRTCSKFSMNLFHIPSLFFIQPPCFSIVQGISSSILDLSREPSPQESDALLRHGAGSGMPDFISWFKEKVPSNLAHDYFDIPSCSYVRII